MIRKYSRHDDRKQIWDADNLAIVLTGWDKHKPVELQGLVNLRQWQLGRREFVTLLEVLRLAVSQGKMTKAEARLHNSHDYVRRKKLPDGELDPLVFGIDPQTGRPVAEKIGHVVSKTDPATGETRWYYRVE